MALITTSVTDTIKKALSCPVFVNTGIMAASLFFLAAALTAEHVFGLKPCILCLYQRAPYALTALLGLIGLVCRKKEMIATLTILAAAIVFTGEAGLAFYHVGVEQHWWVSAFEACKVDFADNGKSLLEQIESTQAVRCDEIPWQMFGISMAGYNVLTALCMAAGCFISFVFSKRR